MVAQSFQWGAFLVFAIVQSATPGPNVILLTSSGSTFGYKKTIPHLLGVCFGFPIMFLVTQLGASEIFQLFPWLFITMTVLSLLYVLWLSIKVFKMGFIDSLQVNTSARPMTFIEAVFFQWINGKAWQMVLMAATLYPSKDVETKLLGALIFIVILMVTGSMWVELGKRITRYLKNKNFRLAYYTALALSLMLSTFPAGIKQIMEFIK